MIDVWGRGWSGVGGKNNNCKTAFICCNNSLVKNIHVAPRCTGNFAQNTHTCNSKQSQNNKFWYAKGTLSQQHNTGGYFFKVLDALCFLDRRCTCD